MNPLYVPVVHGAALDRPDEADTADTAQEIAASLRRLGFETGVIAIDLDLSPLRALAKRGPHVVFNMVEALNGNAVAAALAPAIFDSLGLPYTGVRTDAWCATLSKVATKERLAAAGLPTPSTFDGRHAAGWTGKVIVKSDSEHASVGLDSASVVDAAAACDEIRRREAAFGGRFFAEAFIPGREFNVALLQTAGRPKVLPIQEISFETMPPGRPHIVDYEAKWHPDSAAYLNTPRRFGLERTAPDLAAALRDIALDCWTLFGLDGYARVDFRVGADGAPFVLEVNANPCLASDAGFMATAAEAGLDYDEVIGLIVAAAAGRQEKAA